MSDAFEKDGWCPPWREGPLRYWTIVAINHFPAQDDPRKIRVVLAKDKHIIEEHGIDNQYLWNRLIHKAWAFDEANRPLQPKGRTGG